MNEKFFDGISIIARGMNGESDDTQAIRVGLKLLETKGQAVIDAFSNNKDKEDETRSL